VKREQKATADFSASLRNDKQKSGQQQKTTAKTTAGPSTEMTTLLIGEG
jgi:hypothetical protein